MKRIPSFAWWRILLIAPLGTAVLSCVDAPLPTAETIDTDSPALSAIATRPFRMSGEFFAGGPAVPLPAPCLQAFNAVVHGTGTHLGDFEGVGQTCVTDVVSPDPDPPFLPAGPPPYFTATFSNTLRITAANGDELWLESEGAVAVFSAVNNSLRAIGPHEIVGGTGRFAGATGELQTTSINEDGQGPDDFTSVGWIRY